MKTLNPNNNNTPLKPSIITIEMMNITPEETEREVEEMQLKETELEYETYCMYYGETAYRKIFVDFTLAFDMYVELLHKGDPMAEQFYQNALRVFGERLREYDADYANEISD